MIEDEDVLKWQPVMVIVDGRLECKCGNLGIFVTGKCAEGQYNVLEKVDVWCQFCFQQAQEENE